MKHKFYTSYFGQMKNIPKDYLCISIARFTPKHIMNKPPENFLWGTLDFLAPSKELLYDIKTGKIDHRQYTERYIKQLLYETEYVTPMSFSIQEWFTKFDEIISDKYKAVVFLCYEKPNDFCHRHLLAKLLRYFGFEIEELIIDNKPKVEALF